MATIDNLSIQVTANADSAASALNRLASSASGLRGAVQAAAGGMQSAAQGAQDMGSSTAQAGEQTEKTRKSLHGFWNALKQSGSYLGGAFLGGMKGIVSALGSMASGLLRIAKFRIYRTIVKDLGQSFKDLYGWSKMFGSEYANSMDRINSSFVYLRNSIASAAAPLFNALAPVLDAIIDKIVTLLNWLNQLFSALSGASTYTVAKKVEQSWGSTFTNTSNNAKKTADDIKRTILGFDEINKLSKDKDSSSGGGGGSSPYTSGYQYMFEEKELAGGWKDFATAIENAMSDAFSRITMIVGGAELALGAILALSGANVPLGLGLMATGAVTLGSAIFANWEGISKEVKLAVAGVEAAVAGGLAVGAVLAFSGGHVGLGIGLMIAALSTGMGAATIAWNTIGDKMSEKVQAISTLVGGALFGIGAVLAFAGHPGIGIAMMIAGASVAAVSINWNYLKEKLEGPIGAVTALISGASLALGILALLSGNIPIGLGLILAGTAGLATTVAANWDNLVNIGKTAIEKVKEGWETIKELVVNAVVSLVKKVGEWAEDVWNFLQNTGATIAKKIEAAFDAGKSFAGDVWNFIKTGADTIAKKVTAAFEAGKSFAGDVWDFIKDTGETIKKTVNASISLVKDGWTTLTEWVGDIGEKLVSLGKNGWITLTAWVGNIDDKLVKLGKNGWTTITAWVGNIDDKLVKLGKNGWTTITAWVGNIDDKLVSLGKNGWTTITAWVGNIDDKLVKLGKNGWTTLTAWVGDIEEKLVKLGKDGWTTLSDWVGEIGEKTVSLAMAIENTALAIVNFLRDPADAIKNVILSLGVKFAQGVEKFWNWITGQDGQSEVTVDAYGNFMIVPKAGEGLTDKGNGQFALTNDVAGTTVFTPEKSDNWEEEWDKLVGDEIDVKVKLNAVKGKVEDSIKTWFDNAGGTITTTISTLLTQGGTWIADAWTALTAGDKNVTTKQSVDRGSWDDNAFSALQVGAANVVRAISQSVNRGNWDDSAYSATGIPAVDNLARKITQAVVPGKWDDNAYSATNIPAVDNLGRKVTQDVVRGDWNNNAYAATAIEAVKNLGRKVTQDVVQGDKWNGDAYKATSLEKNSGLTRTVNQVVKQGSGWNKNAYSATKLTANNGLKRSVSQAMSKGAWSDSAYNAAQMRDSTVTKVVQVSVKADPKNNQVIVKPSTQGDGSVKVAVAALGGVLKNGVWRRISQFANGGIFSNGFWKSIPQYAGGTTNAHGSMFLAGEAGPELVGHVGGRTEVLNQSQLAATMFSAVRAAMGGVKIAATMYDGGTDNDEADYEMMYRAMYDAFTDAMAPNAERDREKVALMRQIAAKEFAAEVTANSVNRAQTRMNRRAGTTIVPVGT